MTLLTSILERVRPYCEMRSAVKSGRMPVAATGLSTVHKAHFISALGEQLERHALVIAADESEAGRLCTDLCAMGRRAWIFPSRDLDFYPLEGRSHDYEHTRIEVLSRMCSGEYDVIIATADAAMGLTVPPEQLREKMLTLFEGNSVSMEKCAAALVAAGYERAEQVDGRGQFSIRGGILDLFPPDADNPVRADFWGDDIDSLCSFDLDTQRRSDEHLSEVAILPAAELIIENAEHLAQKLEIISTTMRGKVNDKAREMLLSEADVLRSGRKITNADKYLPLICEREATIFDYLDDEAIVFISEHTAVSQRARESEARLNEEIKQLIEQGILCRALSRYAIAAAELAAKFEINSIFLDSFARGTYDVALKELYNITVRQNAVWSGSLSVLREDLTSLIAGGMSVVILGGTERSCISLAKDLASPLSPEEKPLDAFYAKEPKTYAPGRIMITDGALSAGFEYPEAQVALITWGRAHAKPSTKSNVRRHRAGTAIQDLSELSIGDYIVHQTYGIGIFNGVTNQTFDGVTKAFISIKYAGEQTLCIPITQLDMVSKYIGGRDGGTVKLNKLGTGDWQRQKSRVKKAVKDIAKELTTLYGERLAAKGFAFVEDGDWQRDFELRFEHEETADQLRCIAEIKSDMESGAPMDRLLCGDVGFGKTEVALRAAFKCVVSGKQCAILAPTTILAWQHYQTALRRFDGFPVAIELLSRFRTAKQQTQIIEKLKRGEIDILIGTHRILQKDVEFRDLGLAIIDEEQRFGVAQKERFKEILRGVDILTLSATPIPRTLNMALGGLRDISVIEEAPLDRHPVQTYVLEHDDGVVAEAIRRELRRGGQVFYLHNRVQSIYKTAERIAQLVPEANIAIAHGQMSESEMSRVWKQLVDQEANVLVCTTIIETGVDVPNCNTLIMENADCFGLSQLHQIRGRVGRSTRRAYAYLTFRKNHVLSEIATKRLEAIREFTEFGSGIKIAMRDLELRGAGNLLGGSQSGHMESIGYDLYLKLLSNAVAEAKGEVPENEDVECLIDITIDAYIPDSYIEFVPTRLSIYRLIASIRSEADRRDVIDELTDRFGDVPRQVLGLCDIALLRAQAAKCGISEIRQSNGCYNIRMNEEVFSDAHLTAIVQLHEQLKGRVMFAKGGKPRFSVRKELRLNDLDNITLIVEKLSNLYEKITQNNQNS